MKKMIMSVLVMALMVTSLVGCGNKETVTDNVEPEAVAMVESTPEPTVEPTPEPTPTHTPEPSNEFVSVEEIPVEYLESMNIEDVIIVGGVEFICTEPCKATNETNYLTVTEVEGDDPVVAMYDVVTVVETVELEDNGSKAIETRYSNGTSDYEVWHTNAKNGESLHYKVKGIDSEMTFCTIDNNRQARLQHVDNDKEQIYKVFVCPQGGIESSQINLKNMTDEQVGNFAGSNYIILDRTKTEDKETALIQYTVDTNRTAYDYYVNDYTKGIAYWYMIHASEKYASLEFAQGIMDSIELLD